MSNQQTNHEVLTEAAKREAVAAQLKRDLRKHGIRSTHSKRGREAIERACYSAVRQALLPEADIERKGRGA